MANKRPPVDDQQDPFDMSGVGDIDPELGEQLKSHKQRKAEAEKQARKLARPKATFDLPLAMIERVREVAGQEDVAQSDIAALALDRFLGEYDRGDIDLESLKMPARSLKFAFRLELPGNWN